MDQEVASKKILLTSLITSGIFLLLLALTYQFRSNSLHICNRDNRLTVMLEIPPDKQILFYPDHTDGVIECLTLTMPFYDRTIELVVNQTSNSAVIKDIEKRYEIGKVITKGPVSLKTANIQTTPFSSVVMTTTDKYQIQNKYSQQTEFANGYKIVVQPIAVSVKHDSAVRLVTSEIEVVEESSKYIQQLSNGRSIRFKLN